MPDSPTLDQRRAAHAWKAVETFADHNAPKTNDKRQPNDAAKKYTVHSRKLPTRIIASGLGQALAFLLAKNYCPDLLQALGHWVLEKKDFPASPKELPAADKLLKALIDGDSEKLRLYTAEALAYLQWLVRFVEALGLTGEE